MGLVERRSHRHQHLLLVVAVAAIAIAVGAVATDANDAPAATKPHILMVIVDDFGWAEVGYHREGTEKDQVLTPTIDSLVAEGIELNRHYVHQMCTPTRTSFQSGRLPVHVLQDLAGPCQPKCGVPRNMTGVAQHLLKGGYATHFVGKWDAGMTTPKHTPKGRGYQSSLNYFGHGNWMWNENEWQGSQNNKTTRPPCDPPNCFNDFWDTDSPARNLNNTVYEEEIFRDRMNDIINAHDPSQPLFLTYASKVAHYPLQAPKEYQDKFSFIDQPNRRVYHAMVNYLDDNLKNVTSVLKARGMWNNTLMVLTGDNGGYVLALEGGCDVHTTDGGFMCYNGEAGANNYPLQGGKYSHLEGGVRVNAFVSGGFVPPNMRGTKEEGIVHVADWYATFAALAGVDPTDHEAAASGLPPIDSINMWPLLSGQTQTSPRPNVLLSDQALVNGEWKVLVGKVRNAAWGGPEYPNATTATDPIGHHSRDCGKGCLYNVHVDPNERNDLSAQNPQQLESMLELLANLSKTIWPNDPGNVDPRCAEAAQNLYGGFYGPWMELDLEV
eukprot:m.7069 g.7069  ORF g.7069 m.7069 type:complete len:553 (+) comp2699_c0_seq1:7-1665(+)